MRKVVHGTRSNEGLENQSVLRSLFETARRQGKKAQRFFTSSTYLPKTPLKPRPRSIAGTCQSAPNRRPNQKAKNHRD